MNSNGQIQNRKLKAEKEKRRKTLPGRVAHQAAQQT
jgi:hypothetical protein